MDTVRIAAAQTPDIRHDVEASLSILADFAAQAAERDVRLLCFPEGFLQGYLLDETAARSAAFELNSPAFQAVLERFPRTGPMIVVGMIELDEGRLFNTALVIEAGAVVGRYRKVHLLAGERIFTAGTETSAFAVDGLRFGINICHDTNFPEAAASVANQNASLIVCPTNNMMPSAKAELYRDVHNEVRGERCRQTGLWLISADVTGERDGRLAIGPTAVLNPRGEVVAQVPLGAPGLLVFDMPVTGRGP